MTLFGVVRTTIVSKRSLIGFAGALIGSLAIVSAPSVGAQASQTGTFSIQLTPSPLVQTVKPGVKTTVPVTIRNNGTSSESLKAEIRHFTFNNADGSVAIDDSAAADLSNWVKFSSPTFTVTPGQEFTQNVSLNFPKDSGFSYSFVIIFSRQSQPTVVSGGRLVQGSIADFALVNIDRPGATKALELSSFKSSAGVYEYVPADLSITLKNSGNTIVQPLGNLFISRGKSDDPISTLPFNANQSYILPGTTRTINASWNDGFPHYETTTASDGSTKKQAVWNWGDLSKFRIGQYTARVVAVYNNGSYDVPLNASTTFWIIPWKILLVALAIVLIFLFGIFMIIRGIVKSRRPRGNSGFRL